MLVALREGSSSALADTPRDRAQPLQSDGPCSVFPQSRCGTALARPETDGSPGCRTKRTSASGKPATSSPSRRVSRLPGGRAERTRRSCSRRPGSRRCGVRRAGSHSPLRDAGAAQSGCLLLREAAPGQHPGHPAQPGPRRRQQPSQRSKGRLAGGTARGHLKRPAGPCGRSGGRSLGCGSSASGTGSSRLERPVIAAVPPPVPAQVGPRLSCPQSRRSRPTHAYPCGLDVHLALRSTGGGR